MSEDGFRTGPKKPKKTSSAKKPSSSSEKSSSRKRDSKSVKKTDSKRKRRETGSAPAVKSSKSGKTKAKELPPLESPSKAPLVAGAVVALLFVGGIVAVLSREPDTAPPPSTPETTAILGGVGKTQVAGLPRPVQRTGPALRTQDVKGIEVKVAKPLQVETKPQQSGSDSALEALRKKSSTHAAVARVLDELKELFDPKKLANPGPNFEAFQQRRKREAELIARLREMGPLAVDALKDMILGLNNNHQRIVMGKALAGIEGAQAGDAIQEILKTVKDVSIQTAIVRNLPETQSAADTIAGAFKSEKNPTLRSLLLHEYSNRLGKDVPSDVFREAAKDADINVRATAITIIGRRGDPADQALMQDIIANEKSLMIRQKAILGYALTGGSNSLPTLENLTRDPKSSLAIRASAVLGISRIGGKSAQDAERAIQTLEQIAQSDQSPEIQGRARMYARSLRRNLERKSGPTNRRAPLRVDPGAGPINKR